jgi:crotonobetainyl-CoA:carnitine CoA-transferase CaiB-like acyl-CoA transferase
MAGALEGVRVIDFGQWIAGPLAAMLLADQGAEVIHIDPPGGPRLKQPANATLNRGKKSIELDLKREDDVAFARQLISTADVVIENFRPGVMDRLGLGWEQTSRDYERLIYCSLPGFASDDPRAGMAAWEGVVGAATNMYPSGGGRRGGFAASDVSDDQPRFTALPLASEYAALAGAIGIVMALIARERDGLGQRIEVPLFDAMFLAIGAGGLQVDGAPSGGRPADPWGGTYRCKDGGTVLLNLATPRFVRTLLESSGKLEEWTAKGYLKPELVEDPQLWEQQRKDMTELFASRTAEEWDQLATEVGLALSRIRTSEDWMLSRHANEAGIVVPVEDPEYGKMVQPGPAVRLNGAKDQARGREAPVGSADREALVADRSAAATRSSGTSARLQSALEGFRVIDTSAVLAGPAAARALAEFGADVIKINNPREEGAGYRWQVHRYHTDVNRGKKTVLLDLKSPEGLDVFWRLVDGADVFLQNMRLGVAERLGIGYEQVKARKPDIVYVSVSAFGYGGEWQYRPGYEPIAQSFAGMQARAGGGRDRPGGQPYAVNDYCTGLLGAFAAGLALYHRLRTGEGQSVETALANSATYLQLPYMQLYDGKVWDEPSGPKAKGWGPLQRLYRAADAWFFIGAKRSQLASLAAVPGLEAVKALDGAELESFLEERFQTKNAAEWTAALGKQDIGAYVLGTSVTDLMRDPWVIAHGLSVTQKYKDGSMITTIGPPWRMSRTAVSPRHLASPPGGDAEEVLAEIGMSDRLGELVAKGVIALE